MGSRVWNMPDQNPNSTLRLAVLASGRGSNLQAIIDAMEGGSLEATIAVVVSNNKEVQALERACRHSLPAEFVDPKPFAGGPDSREAYDRAILDVLTPYEVDLVLLAGYMKIVTPVLIEAFSNRMMNIHPSLLPAFPGLNVPQRVLDWGVKIAGCTVHFVTEGVDEGPIIIQAAVPVLEGDSADTLAERILKEEHRLYPLAVNLFAQQRLQVVGRHVHIQGRGAVQEEALVSPSG